jgi:hypothetical protein
LFKTKKKVQNSKIQIKECPDSKIVQIWKKKVQKFENMHIKKVHILKSLYLKMFRFEKIKKLNKFQI